MNFLRDDKAISRIAELKDDIIYLTIGLKYRHPTTLEVPYTKEKLIERIENARGYYFWEFVITDKGAELIGYTDNDLF